MARLARAVPLGIPFHLTHRGNRGDAVFHSDDHRREYLDDLARCCAGAGLAVWGYCLMTNHVHLVAVPSRPNSLARGIGRAHQRHARRVNRLNGWTGHLWANRFFSTPLDPAHLWAAIRYVELNPVRARLAGRAEDWPWSSTRAHAGITPAGPLLDPARPFGGERPHPITGNPMGWADWLGLGLAETEEQKLRSATSTGRPCGSAGFVEDLERALDRPLAPAKRGRKPTP